MKFTTPIDIKKLSSELSYSDRAITLGSCFATEIGQTLKDLSFDVKPNPMGVLYNVASIYSTLDMISRGEHIKSKDLIYENGIYSSYMAHSAFSSPCKDQALLQINNAIDQCKVSIKNSTYIIITLGTSYIYRLESSSQIVANCHRQPSSFFTRDRLSLSQTIDYLEKIVQMLKGKKIVLTVSPIRHIKDGLQENTVSKSILRLAVDHIASNYSNVEYFPSYEIMLDELRDYRFYGEDMVHPTPQAVRYIWERFQQSVCTEKTIELSNKVQKIASRLSHRPTNPQSPTHQSFLAATLKMITQLENQDSNIDFTNYKSIINNQLIVNES